MLYSPLAFKPVTSLSVTLKNDVSQIPRLAQMVSDFCSRNGLPSALELDLNLALEEAVINVIAHGYAEEGLHDIHVSLALESGELTVQVQDDGLAFNPLEAAPVDLSVPPDQRRVGGLGIHFVRQLMDRIEYERSGGRNILTMSKRTGVSE